LSSGNPEVDAAFPPGSAYRNLIGNSDCTFSPAPSTAAPVPDVFTGSDVPAAAASAAAVAESPDLAQAGGIVAPLATPEPLEDHHDISFADMPTPPNLEMCDGLDNDGNGKIDEDCPDSDKDTVADAIDNCPLTPNTDQADSGADLLGDACRLPQVTDLAAAPDGKGGIVLNWKANTADVFGFTVYRTPCGGNPEYLGGYPTAMQPY
jgi:hypothetical protein